MQFGFQDLIVHQIAAQTRHLVQAPVQMQDLDQTRAHTPVQTLILKQIRAHPPVQALALNQTQAHPPVQTLVLKQTPAHPPVQTLALKQTRAQAPVQTLARLVPLVHGRIRILDQLLLHRQTQVLVQLPTRVLAPVLGQDRASVLVQDQILALCRDQVLGRVLVRVLGQDSTLGQVTMQVAAQVWVVDPGLVLVREKAMQESGQVKATGLGPREAIISTCNYALFCQ